MAYILHTRTLTSVALLLLAVVTFSTHAMDTNYIPINDQRLNTRHHPYKLPNNAYTFERSKLSINDLLTGDTNNTALNKPPFLPLPGKELQGRASHAYAALTTGRIKRQDELPVKIKDKTLSILNTLASESLDSEKCKQHHQQLAEAYIRITQPYEHGGRKRHFSSVAQVWNAAMAGTSDLHPYMALCLMLMLEKISFADENGTNALMVTSYENNRKVLRLFSFTQTPFTHLKDKNGRTAIDYASSLKMRKLLTKQAEKEKLQN